MVTLVFIVFGLIVQFVLGYLLAVALHRHVRRAAHGCSGAPRTPQPQRTTKLTSLPARRSP